MSGLKWIGATLGWSLGGPIGAIIGLALGSLGDAFSNGKGNILLGDGRSQRKRSQRRSTQQRTTYSRRTQQERPKTQSGDFEVSLLILASIVIMPSS